MHLPPSKAHGAREGVFLPVAPQSAEKPHRGVKVISKGLHTPNEKWCTRINSGYDKSWYDLCTAEAVAYIGAPSETRTRLLVIGSPVVEVHRFGDLGWVPVYADVRKPPQIESLWIKCDATDLSRFGDASFDAVSTTGVLTHVGLGRYGDAKVRGGDAIAVQGISRVLRAGGRAALTFGAVIDAPEPIIWGTTHKIYTTEDAQRITREAGLRIENTRFYRPAWKRWLRDGEALSKDPNAFDWISIYATKP